MQHEVELYNLLKFFLNTSLLIAGIIHCSDELAFIQAIASETSLMYLPCQADHGFFHRQQNAIEQLQTVGWHIHAPATQTLPSLGEQLAQRFIEQKATILDATAIHAHVYPDKEAEAIAFLWQKCFFAFLGVRLRIIEKIQDLSIKLWLSS